MCNPLYFVTNCKECAKLFGAIPLPMGCGVEQDGQLRRPKNFWHGSPLLFDDAVLAMPTEKCRRELKALTDHGCILDFERKPAGFHQQILKLMQEWKTHPLWIPEAFSFLAPHGTVILSGSFLHNNWKEYCRSLQNKYPNRWALEFQPISWEKKLHGESYRQSSFFLPDALCMCRVEKEKITYFDTLQTLEKKMSVAREWGCQGGIALWQEWENKTMAQP